MPKLVPPVEKCQRDTPVLSAIGRALSLVAGLAILAGCARPLDMTGDRMALPGPEWGVVIGSVLVQREAEQPEKLSAGGLPAAGETYRFDVVQIQPGDPEGTRPYAPEYHLTAKGGEERVFLSRLRPGQYLIRAFHEASMVGLGGDLEVVFSVPPGEVAYVGRLQVQIPRRLTKGKGYRFTIDNVRAQTLAQLSQQQGDLADAALDHPMQVRLRAIP